MNKQEFNGVVAELLPCPFCGGSNTQFRENTHWTGMRSEIISVQIYHWCDNASPYDTLTITLKDKTHEDVAELWNSRTNPDEPVQKNT